MVVVFSSSSDRRRNNQKPIHDMDSSSSSQRQQQQYYYPSRPLQGPRPAPLSINKESVKIRKPPPAPAPAAAHSRAAAAQPSTSQQQQQRGPIIIYTVSPKVIHTKPSEFMSLVQRLTGMNSSASDVAAASTSLPSPICPSPSGALSPAARLATIEKAQLQGSDNHGKQRPTSGDLDIIDRYDQTGGVSATLDRSSNFLGILSPNPLSLPTIAPNYFTSGGAPELNSLGFLHDMMSPAVPVNRNYMDGSNLLPISPNLFATPSSASPNWDSFSLFQDL